MPDAAIGTFAGFLGGAAVALPFLVGLPSSADARLVVCSASPATVLLAVARWENRRFVARGWYAVAPRACRTLIRLPLPRGGKYYVSVRAAGAVFVRPAAARGGRALCVPQAGRFAVSIRRAAVRVCRRAWRVYRFSLHRPRTGRIRLSVSPAR